MRPYVLWRTDTTNWPALDLIAHETDTRVCEAVALWAAILEEAAKENDGGWFALDWFAAAFRLGLDAGSVEAIRDGLIDRGLLSKEPEGWRVLSWEIDHDPALASADPPRTAPPLRLPAPSRQTAAN